MAVRTASAAGGNFNATGTWVGGVVPINNDSIIVNSSSGNITVTTNTVNLQSADFTGYTGTLALGSNNIVFNASPANGTITLSPTMTITRTIGNNGTIRIQQPTTIVSNGKEIPLSTPALQAILTLSGDLSVSVYNSNAGATITGNANLIITDPVPAAFNQGVVAAGSKVIYRPSGGTLTTTTPIGTGHFQFDASGISLGLASGMNIHNTAQVRNAPTIMEFLQTPIFSGIGAPSGKPIFFMQTNSSSFNGLTMSLIMATNSNISQFILDGGNAANTVGLSIQNRLNIDEISFKTSFSNGFFTSTYNVLGGGGFSASRVAIIGVKNTAGNQPNTGTIVRFAADAEYTIGSLNITGFIGNSPSVVLSSLTPSVPVTMNISNGGFSYAYITDINNTGTSLYALSANGNILTRTTGFIDSVSAGGAGGSFTFVN
jgi:hypothetical protein